MNPNVWLCVRSYNRLKQTETRFKAIQRTLEQQFLKLNEAERLEFYRETGTQE